MKSRKQLNIRLENSLHTKAKLIAILKNKTLNDYIEEAIKKQIAIDKKVLERLEK